MKIKFEPLDIEIEGDSGKSLLDLAKDAGIQIKSVCGGTASCAECKIQLKDGEYNVLPPSAVEIALIGTAHFVDRSRLACQLRCFGDVVVNMNEQIEKQNSGATTKRPRGKAQKAEGEQSHAVEGSILLGGADLEIFGSNLGEDKTGERQAVQMFDEDETNRALEQIRRKRETQAKQDAEDEAEKLKRPNNKNNRNQNKNASGGGNSEAGKGKARRKKSNSSNRSRSASGSADKAQDSKKKAGSPEGQKPKRNRSRNRKPNPNKAKAGSDKKDS